MATPFPSLILGSPQWLTGAGIFLAFTALLLLWSYGRSTARLPVKIVGAMLKAAGFTALAFSLVEPLLTGSRPKIGANAFAVLVDDSQSLLVRGEGQATRGDWFRERLKPDASWWTRLSQDFDVRRYLFDTHLRATEDFEDLAFDGNGSALTTSLETLSKRFRGLPLAGALVFTDGNRTDLGELDPSSLPPIYPVLPPSRTVLRDVGVTDVSVSQTNFEAAPVVIRADVAATGVTGEIVVATVTDENGKELAREELKAREDGRPLSYRLQFRPDQKGVNFLRVNAFAASDPPPVPNEPNPPSTREQTFVNNSRLVVADQGGGPYRVLYVSGRPNWEFKFIRRALADDEQVELVGLLRIALRQPKFDFRNPRDRSTSEFYKGFENPDAETAERADQPVLVRFGTRDETELRDGFPKTAEELYAYHAVILDDLEAKFFSPDQLALLRNFVSVRGGGLLMLGGPDSFADGRYDRTPVGDLLPVYLDRASATSPVTPALEREYRLLLTRDGWLQPWVRTRKTEEDERVRLARMPAFKTLSRVGPIKPGAEVLAEVRSEDGATAPGLVAQRYGKGHAAALMVGDLWRWAIRRESAAEDDIERSWRQTVRWLVGDVTGRVEVSVTPKAGSASPAVELRVKVRDAEYRPLDNARVSLELTLPGGDALTLDAEPDGREAGTYAATYVARKPGPYRVVARATAPDGSAVGDRESGWAAQPAADEFARLTPDREFLESLAAKTGGEVVDGDRLDSFVASLASRAAPITEPWTSPLWHQPLYFLIALGCLTAEWGLRRVNGLA
ncbi:MAG: glutamine amidotransferase [Isosphaeraceae bacterium]